jgi:hypothetical protein
LAREQKECAAKAHSRIRWLPALAGAAAIGLALLLTPHIFSPYRPMSSQEALDAYAEDFKALGVWEEEENGAGDSFKYENYGIPESVSRYMI